MSLQYYLVLLFASSTIHSLSRAAQNVLANRVPDRTFLKSVVDPPDPCASNPNCINIKQPLLTKVRAGLIDKDTPKSAYTKTSVDGSQMQLVVSISTDVLCRMFQS